MPLVTLYFQLHQPFRLHPDTDKFLWEEQDRQVFRKVAEKNYLPATHMFIDLVRTYPDFKLTFSMSGTFLQQAEMYQPEVVRALQVLYDAGREHNQVEYLEETYYHSLTGLFEDPEKHEFKDQVSMHRQKMRDIFGIKPTSFRNTELMYNNDIANIVADMGYKAILCEQRDDMYTPRDGKPISPNAVFRAKGRRNRPRDLIVIPRNRNLSDDVAFRFKDNHLSAEHYADNIGRVDGEMVMLGYDYEHIGEHIWADTGIFDFWRHAAYAMTHHPSIRFANPTEIVEHFKEIDCPVIDIHPLSTSSWADVQRNTHGWLGTQTQYTLFRDLEKLEADARRAGGDRLQKWRYLTTSDHLYYLHEGVGADRSVHDYFSPYGSLGISTFLLTRNIDRLENSLKTFTIHIETVKTPVIIITPETARLPTQGMGEFARFVSGKSGGLGDVISALLIGLVDREIPVHLITLNLSRRFREESGMSEDEWIKQRHNLNPECVHLVTSSIFENHQSAYDGDPVVSAAEFQKQVVNFHIRQIRSQFDGRAIIHSHDWMAGGAITAYARLRDIPVLHTVHNTHSAHIPLEVLQGLNLGRMWNNLYVSWDMGRQCLDAQATAIKNASKISYVGQRFLKEIISDFFQDRPIISWPVREETKVKYHTGSALVIPNGISTNVYPENQPENPDHDKPGLARKFGPLDDVLAAKRENLLKFQKKMGLRHNPDAILLYWPSRLDPMQKGIELLEVIAQNFVIQHPDVQIAVVGNPVGGNWEHADIVGRIACDTEGKIAYHRFDEDLSILGYAAASDVFGASLYEPFGQIDVIGNLYGATATNRETGGYADKIVPLSLKSQGAPQDLGNGVLFKNYDPGGLWWALSKTVDFHRYFRQNPHEWARQVKRIMQDARRKWTLENMVAGYISAYEDLNAGKPLT